MIHLPILLLSPGVKKKKINLGEFLNRVQLAKNIILTFSVLRKLQKLNYLQQKKKNIKRSKSATWLISLFLKLQKLCTNNPAK